MDNGSRCGSCTLCCKLTAVPELAKPLYMWCKNCIAGRGCQIYNQRPQTCRIFECGWYMDMTLSPELRPDRCNVVFERLYPYKIFLASVDPSYPDSWNISLVQQFIHQLMNENLSVAVNPGPRRRPFIFPAKGTTHEKVWEEIHEFAREQGILSRAEGS